MNGLVAILDNKVEIVLFIEYTFGVIRAKFDACITKWTILLIYWLEQLHYVLSNVL